MSTITLSYDSQNALARRKLADLLRSGLFAKAEPSRQSPDTIEEKRQLQEDEVQAFLQSSKKNMAGIIAKYL